MITSAKKCFPPTPSEHAFDVEANHRGYIFDHETEEGFKREIDMAADIGAEMFVIDAGWYGQDPNHWAANVGDWRRVRGCPTTLDRSANMHGKKECASVCGWSLRASALIQSWRKNIPSGF